MKEFYFKVVWVAAGETYSIDTMIVASRAHTAFNSIVESIEYDSLGHKNKRGGISPGEPHNLQVHLYKVVEHKHSYNDTWHRNTAYTFDGVKGKHTLVNMYARCQVCHRGEITRQATNEEKTAFLTDKSYSVD